MLTRRWIAQLIRKDRMSPLLIGFLIYFLITIVVGFAAVRRNKSLESYLLADRKLGAWVAAFSERASGESAWLLIGLPGVAFVSGLSALWVAIGCVTGIAFSWFTIARRLRTETERFDALTLADYFEARFNDRTHALRLTATAIILFFFTFYVAAQFLAAGKVLNVYLGLTPVQGMLIGAVLVLFYTAAGGLYAVAWTDLVQGIIMLFTLSILPLAVMNELGGPSATVERISVLGGSFMSWAPGDSGWAATSGILGSLAIGLGYMGQPHLVLRFMAISSPNDVSKGRIIAVVWAVIAFGGAVLVGLVGLAHYGPDAMGTGLAIADQEQLMPVIAREFMPEWLAVIMICGAIAAMMSTADSQLLSSASAVSEDIYRRMINPDADQVTLLRLSRLATLAIGIVAFLLAWRADSLVYSLVLYAWAGLGAAFGPPLFLSLWWRRTSRAGVLSGLIVGTVTVLIWYNVPVLKSQLYEMIPGFVLSLAATILGSILLPDAAIVDGGIDHD
jgi:sodium/proline symporter